MIGLALLALAAAVAPSGDDEIVVMGRTLEGLAVILARDPAGKLSCNLSASSGDRGVDAGLCKTAARCFKQGAIENAAMRACIDARKPAILNEFAARVRARQG